MPWETDDPWAGTQTPMILIPMSFMWKLKPTPCRNQLHQAALGVHCYLLWARPGRDLQSAAWVRREGCWPSEVSPYPYPYLYPYP